MRALDAILCIVLVVGNVLGLPIWWWLFGTPIVRIERSTELPQRGLLGEPRGNSLLVNLAVDQLK